ncbi:5'/3'-nucleotidase SurE [Thiospirillum jenense]|uniref:5'-nucleotidase SurE n=1 Tax=Thiospirillum jenense TaxID=1653858 RepID=A0A839HF52_9GAMM|nr:5'/3'-nucleotidase SurE [Thiospirillum jenense]MBB1125797.1 5'/3'-nucleotidase SurE [Thiospirillum jenense]
MSLNILLSNDDGYRSPGLQVLAAELSRWGRVTIVAPDRDRSGASNSLTLDAPIRAERLEPDFYRVAGTPTDCVHLAMTGLLEHEPDLVVAGINHGPNLGDDVVYSGTVAAATEGRFLGLPAIAVSIAAQEPRHLATAAAITGRLVTQLSSAPLAGNLILNVNVPDIPLDQVRGLLATRLGNRHKAEPVVPVIDPRGRRMYWVGAAGPEQDAGEGTDFHAIRLGYVSITPLHVDLTRHSAIAPLGQWLDALC